MPLPVLPTAALRELDRRAVADFGVPSLVLMENAGRGVADRLAAVAGQGPVVICCGRGNNGGDGLVIARHLDLRGVAVRVLLFLPADKFSGAGESLLDRAALCLSDDAAANFAIVRRSGIALRVLTTAEGMADELRGATWIVDALLGTGSHGEPRAPLDAVIRAINASGIPVLAVDVPSGLDADSGEPARVTIRGAADLYVRGSQARFSGARRGGLYR